MKYLPILLLFLAACGGAPVEQAHVGFTGEPSEIYALYAALLRVAPDTLWRKLTFSKKPVMRYYAFKALMEKKDPGLPQVIARLEKDSAGVEVTSGCSTIGLPICLWVAFDSGDTAFRRKWWHKAKHV